MKIAYDPQIFSTQEYGGVSRYFCEIAARIANLDGADISIVSPMYVNAYLLHSSPKIVKGFRAPNTEQFLINSGKNYSRLAFRALGLLMGDLMLRVINPDIVHETYFSPYGLGRSRARRVITIHDMIHEKFPSYFSRSDKTAQFKAIAAERADHIICVSKSTQRDVIEILKIPPEKTSVIYHGFDLSGALQDPNGVHSVDFQKPFLLYVGKRGGYKNFLRLLEAFATSSTLKSTYILTCFGGGGFNADELEAIRRLGLTDDQVLQIGGGDQLLACLYHSASAFIYPSLYEGFGIPPLEAMSYGCPVVCSDISSIPEVVGDAGEYFDPENIDSMRLAIERVVTSNHHQQLLRIKGGERLKKFSWDRCASETLDVYEELL